MTISLLKVGSGSESTAIRSALAKLTVLVPPGQPKIAQHGSLEEGRTELDLEVEEGESLELTCISEGGRPAGEITWRDEEGEQVSRNGWENLVLGIAELYRFVQMKHCPGKVTCRREYTWQWYRIREWRLRIGGGEGQSLRRAKDVTTTLKSLVEILLKPIIRTLVDLLLKYQTRTLVEMFLKR